MLPSNETQTSYTRSMTPQEHRDALRAQVADPLRALAAEMDRQAAALSHRPGEMARLTILRLENTARVLREEAALTQAFIVVNVAAYPPAADAGD